MTHVSHVITLQEGFVERYTNGLPLREWLKMNDSCIHGFVKCVLKLAGNVVSHFSGSVVHYSYEYVFSSERIHA